jgi:hypothetical protein
VKDPNPQGKGLVPVLAHWQATRPRAVRAKRPAELLLDLFSSTLVLSARCDFRPVPGQRYYLYCGEGDWRLSLVSPAEWGERAPGACLGACTLREDMTWGVVADPELQENAALRSQLAALAEDFLARLDVDGELADQLPGYRRDLPYYRRLLATGVGASLRQSLDAAGATRLGARESLRLGAESLLQAVLTHAPEAGEDASSSQRKEQSP